jgi:hypothetical protein
MKKTTGFYSKVSIFSQVFQRSAEKPVLQNLLKKVSACEKMLHNVFLSSAKTAALQLSLQKSYSKNNRIPAFFWNDNS